MQNWKRVFGIIWSGQLISTFQRRDFSDEHCGSMLGIGNACRRSILYSGIKVHGCKKVGINIFRNGCWFFYNNWLILQSVFCMPVAERIKAVHSPFTRSINNRAHSSDG